MTLLRVHLFGGMVLAWDGDPLPTISSDTARSLFALLVTYRDRPHTRDLLAGTYWPYLPDATARRRLSRAPWQIRSTLRQVVRQHPKRSAGQDNALAPHSAYFTEWDTVQLNPGLPIWLDTEESRRKYAQIRGAVLRRAV